MEDITSIDFSMLTYLQCFGGCGNAKDVGLMQYGLSFILDAAIHGDLEGVREHAALMAVGLEQVAQGQRCWELGFQLMLLEDRPSQMWTFRNADLPQTGRTRAFVALCPQRWATIARLLEGGRLHSGQKNGPEQDPDSSTLDGRCSKEEVRKSGGCVNFQCGPHDVLLAGQKASSGDALVPSARSDDDGILFDESYFGDVCLAAGVSDVAHGVPLDSALV